MLRFRQTSFVVGARPDSEIVIDEPAVSSRHCRITSHRDGFLIQDLNSTNGTFVSGKRIYARTLVAADDNVTLGQQTGLPWEAVQNLMKQQRGTIRRSQGLAALLILAVLSLITAGRADQIPDRPDGPATPDVERDSGGAPPANEPGVKSPADVEVPDGAEGTNPVVESSDCLDVHPSRTPTSTALDLERADTPISNGDAGMPVVASEGRAEAVIDILVKSPSPEGIVETSERDATSTIRVRSTAAISVPSDPVESDRRNDEKDGSVPVASDRQPAQLQGQAVQTRSQVTVQIESQRIPFSRNEVYPIVGVLKDQRSHETDLTAMSRKERETEERWQRVLNAQDWLDLRTLERYESGWRPRLPRDQMSTRLNARINRYSREQRNAELKAIFQDAKADIYEKFADRLTDIRARGSAWGSYGYGYGLGYPFGYGFGHGGFGAYGYSWDIADPNALRVAIAYTNAAAWSRSRSVAADYRARSILAERIARLRGYATGLRFR